MVRRMLVVAASAALLAPSVAQGDSPFGGRDGKINDDAEIRALVKNAKREQLGVPELLTGLDAAERATVLERGLTPAGPPISGSSNEAPPDDLVARSAHAGSGSRTLWCYRKSLAGIKQYQYNSHWNWTWGSAHNIRSASHSEWPSNTAPGWTYKGDKYLWATGALFTPIIGRATQARFAWQPLGYFLWDAYLINNVKVWAHGWVNYCS